MNNYNSRDTSQKRGFKSGERSDGSDFKKKSYAGRSSDDIEVTFYKATCADCKKTCEVPFRPNGEKPVFCRDCFGSKKGADERGGERNVHPQFENRGMAHTWSDRSAARPTYASDAKPQVSDEMKRQFSDILYKIEKLTTLVEKLVHENSILLSKGETRGEIVEEQSATLGTDKENVTVKKRITKKVAK